MNSEVRPAFYHALVPRHRLMPSYQCRSFRKVTSVISIGALLAFITALVAYQPHPQPDRAGYKQCKTLYPERYCAITFLGAH